MKWKKKKKKGAKKLLQLGKQIILLYNENTRSGRQSLHGITIRYYY